MIRGSSLPPKRAFVEVRQGEICIVGQVVWSQGFQCGVHTREPVDLAALLSRRATPTPLVAMDQRDAAASRQLSRLIEWLALVLAGSMAAAALAAGAHSILSGAFEQVGPALHGALTP
jgi:hypothetical protein